MHTEDSLDDLLESVETMVSSQIDSISTTAVENILRNFTSEYLELSLLINYFNPQLIVHGLIFNFRRELTGSYKTEQFNCAASKQFAGIIAPG